MFYHLLVMEPPVPSPSQAVKEIRMKTAIRVIALSLVLAGAAAASVSPSTARPFSSHQSATATNPIPLCAPGLPTCPGR
jgi:hypothetical protein